MMSKLNILHIEPEGRPRSRPKKRTGDSEDVVNLRNAFSLTGYPFSIRTLTRHDSLPDTFEADLVCVTGGISSVNDGRDTWLHEATDRIATRTAQNKATFGICLGHQMIAVANDGEVSSCDPEWGIVRVEATNGNQSDVVFSQTSDYWVPMASTHGETVSNAPEQAVCVGRTPNYDNFVLRYSPQVLSCQGHPELTRAQHTHLTDKHGITTGYGMQIIDTSEEALAAMRRSLFSTIVESVR